MSLTPETDLIRCHQDLEEGERFESWLEIRKMLFSGSPEDRHTLFPSFMEGTEITLGWVCFPWGKGKLFQDNWLTTSFSEPRAGGRSFSVVPDWCWIDPACWCAMTSQIFREWSKRFLFISIKPWRCNALQQMRKPLPNNNDKYNNDHVKSCGVFHDQSTCNKISCQASHSF